MQGASLLLERGGTFVYEAGEGSSFEAVPVVFRRARGSAKAPTLTLKRFQSVLEQTGSDSTDPLSKDQSFVVGVGAQVQRYPGIPLHRGERLVVLAGCVVTHLPLRLVKFLLCLLVERESFCAVFTNDLHWGVPERKVVSPGNNPFHDFVSGIEEAKHHADVYNEVLIKSLLFLETYGLCYPDLFLTSLNPHSCAIEEQQDLLEALVRLCMPDDHLSCGFERILLPSRRRHLEMICRVICLLLGKAFQPKPITAADQDLFLGYCEGLSEAMDHEKESFKEVWRNCNNPHMLLALLGFIERLGERQENVNEQQLHFCCMAAPYLMDLPDPNMLVKLAKEGLSCMVEIDGKGNSSDPILVGWTALNVVVSGLVSDLEELRDYAEEFFMHHYPVEMFQASVWRTPSREFFVDSGQVSQFCESIAKLHDKADPQMLEESYQRAFEELDVTDVEQRCLLSATAIPQMLFSMNDEPLVPPFLYDSFIVAASTLHDHVGFNYALLRLLRSVPSPRREVLHSIVISLSLSSSLKDWRDPTTVQSIAKRFGPCVLRPRLVGSSTKVEEIEALHAHRRAITRAMLAFISFENYFFRENNVSVSRCFADIHEAFKVGTVS